MDVLTRVIHASRGPAFIAAQFVPMAVLALTYHLASDRIEDVELGGVRLDRLLLTSAIIAPILSQSVSGPLFRSLEVTARDRFSLSATLVLRNLPRAMLVAAPVLLGLVTLAAMALGLDQTGTVALAGVVWVHVLFAASMVPAYAHRNGLLLIVGWVAYAAVLALAPELWWAPAFAGFMTQLVVQLHVCEVRLPLVPVVSFRDMVAGMARGVSLALPLWCLPVAAYLGSDGTVSPVAIFLSLTPALLAYQIYFVQVATPMWNRIDRARRMLADDAYASARGELMTISSTISSGLLKVVAVLWTLLVATGAVVYRNDPVQGQFLLVLMFSAGLAVVVIAEVTRLAMVQEGHVMSYVSAGIVGALMLGTAVGASAFGLLLVHAAACVAALIALAAANHRAWRSPEYSLFWSSALQH